MGYLETAHERRKKFYAEIAAKAVPDKGIDLSQERSMSLEDYIAQKRAAEAAAERAIKEQAEAAIRDARAKAEATFQVLARRYTFRSIIAATAEEFGVDPCSLVGPVREKKYVLPRHIAMWLAKRSLRVSYPEIGRRFGGRDHTTALHGCRRIDRLYREDDGLRARIDGLTQQLAGKAA